MNTAPNTAAAKAAHINIVSSIGNSFISQPSIGVIKMNVILARTHIQLPIDNHALLQGLPGLSIFLTQSAAVV